MTDPEREDVCKVVEALANACGEEATTAHHRHQQLTESLELAVAGIGNLTDAISKLAGEMAEQRKADLKASEAQRQADLKEHAEQRQADRVQQENANKLLLDKVGGLIATVTANFKVVEDLNTDLTQHLKLPHAVGSRAR